MKEGSPIAKHRRKAKAIEALAKQFRLSLHPVRREPKFVNFLEDVLNGAELNQEVRDETRESLALSKKIHRTAWSINVKGDPDLDQIRHDSAALANTLEFLLLKAGEDTRPQKIREFFERSKKRKFRGLATSMVVRPGREGNLGIPLVQTNLIFDNILENAEKASRSIHGKVHVTVNPAEENGMKGISLTVHNLADINDRVLEAQQDLYNGPSEEPKWKRTIVTTSGAVITKRLLDHNGGHARVWTEPGPKGSKYRYYNIRCFIPSESPDTQ